VPLRGGSSRALRSRAAVLGLIAACALVTLAVAAGAAASSTPDDGSGPTAIVVAADDGSVRAAVRFPRGWRLESVTDPAHLSIHALGIDERCELSTRRSIFEDPIADVDDFVVGLGPGSGFILLERSAVELPAGSAERIDFADEAGAHWSVYAIPEAGYMHELWCRGDALPDDRWLPIAETFDLDPDPARASSPFQPRVERADAGVTMAFGEEWEVRGSSTAQGLLYATSPTAVCSLSDYSSLATDNGWQDVDDMHEAYVAVAQGRDDLEVDESAYLALPAGRTGFADLAFADGTRAIRYSFGGDEGVLMALFCVGDPTPEDRYRSLAESVTWLAADDG
jgi:hypothetical protein